MITRLEWLWANLRWRYWSWRIDRARRENIRLIEKLALLLPREAEAAEKMKRLKAGDHVTIRYMGREVEGVVRFASDNGKSLMLQFDGMLGGYVGMMPVLDDGSGYKDLIVNQPVELLE